MQVRDPCMTANVLIVPLCETVRLSVYLASAEDAHSTVSHACVACQAASFVPLLVQETEVAFKIRYVPFKKSTYVCSNVGALIAPPQRASTTTVLSVIADQLLVSRTIVALNAAKGMVACHLACRECRSNDNDT